MSASSIFRFLGRHVKKETFRELTHSLNPSPSSCKSKLGFDEQPPPFADHLDAVYTSIMLRPVSRTGLFHCKRQLGVSPITRSLSSLVPSRPCSPLNISTKLRQLRQFTSSAAPNSDRLTWDEFLRVRRQRRLTGLLAAVPSSAFGIYLGFQYFGSGEIDPTKTIFGLDPFLVNSALVLGCGLLGWLAGPTVGKGFWYVFDRKQVQLFSQVRPSMMSCSR